MHVSEVVKDANVLNKVLDDTVEEIGEENAVQVVILSTFLSTLKKVRFLLNQRMSPRL